MAKIEGSSVLPSFPLPPPFYKLHGDPSSQPPDPPPPPQGQFPLFGIVFDPVKLRIQHHMPILAIYQDVPAYLANHSSPCMHLIQEESQVPQLQGPRLYNIRPEDGSVGKYLA